MILSEAKSKEMLEASKPLMKWMSENCHPHCTAIVDVNSVELVEGIATVRTVEFTKD